MCKSFSTIILFLLFLVTSTSSIFAEVPVSNVTPTPTQSSSIPQTPSYNPGFTNGLTCGNTVCLLSETCVTYPGETQPHCVPVKLNSIVPEKCNKTFLVDFGNNAIYPPNSSCYPDVTNTQIDLSNYEKTCVYEPIANFSDNRGWSGNSGKEKCGPPGGDNGPGVADPNNCDVYILANTDLSQATLGSYGPDVDTINSKSSDYLSQNYLYNSLFDRPSGNLDDANREAYRTYWRIMSASNQANLRSFILNMSHSYQIKNTQFNYVNEKGKSRKITFNDLYNVLSKQVIVFLHWPFFRQGCLIQYPVCPEYAHATEALTPYPEKIGDLLKAIIKLIPNELVVKAASGLIDAYINIINFLFYGDPPRYAYDAFTPLSFDSVRSFIILNGQPDTVPKSVVNKFGENLKSVSREHLPYIEAIALGLLSPKFSMVSSLQPQWVVNKYATPGASLISDYKIGNDPLNLNADPTNKNSENKIELTGGFPEVYLSKKGIDIWFQEQMQLLFTNPLEWFQPVKWVTDTVTSITESISSVLIGNTVQTKKGYSKIYVGGALNSATHTIDSKEKEDITTADVITQYENLPSCPMPVSYHLLSPKTIPLDDNKDAFYPEHQIIHLQGNEINWSLAPVVYAKETCDQYGNCYPAPCPSGPQYFMQDDICYEKHWNLSATKHGRTLTVLNNPKQSDIQKIIASEPQIALYDMLLPADSQKSPEAKIDAPIAQNNYVSITGSGGSASVTNPYSSIMRVSNLAQDSLHLLQNCWSVPKELQNSPKCVIPTPSTSVCNSNIMSKITSSITCKTKGNSLNIPQSLLDAIQAAGSAYNVPPSLIVGLIYGEGTFNPGSKFLDSAYVDANLACGVIEGCSPTAPYVNTLVPSYPLANWNVLKDAVKVLDPSRTPNVCNMLDMVYAIAKDASVNQNGSSVYSGKSCYGIPLNAGSGGSNSCSNWDNSDIETAIRVWEAGYSSLNCFTKVNSCATGGGENAACEAGFDNCEKNGTSGNSSHNACLYDKATTY